MTWGGLGCKPFGSTLRIVGGELGYDGDLDDIMDPKSTNPLPSAQVFHALSEATTASLGVSTSHTWLSLFKADPAFPKELSFGKSSQPLSSYGLKFSDCAAIMGDLVQAEAHRRST